MATDLPELDESIVRLPADILQDLAVRASRDLYVFTRGVLGYHDLVPHAHKPLCVFFDQNPSRFKLTLMPRGHFKTTIGTIGRMMQKVCQNVETRLLLANETKTNAERFLSAIKSHAEGNRVFRALYSDIIPKDIRRIRWNQEELEFRRQSHHPEPTIDTMGITGAWTSRHFNHITFDDPISEEAAQSALVMENAITRVSKVFSLMVNADLDTFDLTGTRWAFFDVYSAMEKNFGRDIVRFVRGEIEDGLPIFPERFSLATLAQIRKNLGEYMYSCNYRNNPRNPELQDFNVQDLRFWKWSSDESHVVFLNKEGGIDEIVEKNRLDVTCCVDLAPAEKITSDRNAVTVCGVTPGGKVAVLEAWARRCTPLQLIDKLLEVRAKYLPRIFGIESVAYQKSLKYFVKQESARRGVYMNIVDMPAKGKKEVRVRGLQPICATGRLYVDPTQLDLRNEMADFPLGEHDDLIDSLSMHLQLWRGLMSPAKWEKYRESEKRLLANIDGYGLRSDAMGHRVGGWRESINLGARHSRNPQDRPHPDDLDIPEPRVAWQESVIE